MFNIISYMISFDYLASPGQLGNQMFKYAALRGIAKANNQNFLMPPSYLFLKNRLLFRLARRLKIIDNKNHANHLLFKYFEMKSVKAENIGYSNLNESIKEDRFEFDNKFFNLNNENTDINGYFQSYKYFDSIKKEIKLDFKFKEAIKLKSEKIRKKFEDPVSIHIRRGDFITNLNHSALEMNYYYNCIEIFGLDKEYLIFSDDTKWCKQQPLFRNKNFYFAKDFTENSESLDLSLLTLCNNHIIANSSFSWWGAWLSSQNKVLAPKNWFKNSATYSKYNTKDLLPTHWIKIEN